MMTISENQIELDLIAKLGDLKYSLHYSQWAALERWSVREWRSQIGYKAFEPRVIANAQAIALNSAV